MIDNLVAALEAKERRDQIRSALLKQVRALPELPATIEALLVADEVATRALEMVLKEET